MLEYLPRILLMKDCKIQVATDEECKGRFEQLLSIDNMKYTVKSENKKLLSQKLIQIVTWVKFTLS